jgi:N-acetyl-gamma-glutamyl-phosphate reductase
MKAGIVDVEHGVVCDAKSGVSGAGKTPTAKTHFVEVSDNLSAYNVFGHRHTGEILEQVGLKADQLIFTPHLLPIPRGILSTMYLRLKQPTSASVVEPVYREFYKGAEWVRVFGAGKLPQIQFSVRTNYCDVGFVLAEDGKRLIVVSCLDNLMKGAAGQALQNMNVMYGWSEREGLN